MTKLFKKLVGADHEPVAATWDLGEIHFPPVLHVRMSKRLRKRDLTRIDDDCSGQMVHSINEQRIGCWCASIRFGGGTTKRR